MFGIRLDRSFNENMYRVVCLTMPYVSQSQCQVESSSVDSCGRAAAHILPISSVCLFIPQFGWEIIESYGVENAREECERRRARTEQLLKTK